MKTLLAAFLAAGLVCAQTMTTKPDLFRTPMHQELSDVPTTPTDLAIMNTVGKQ